MAVSRNSAAWLTAFALSACEVRLDDKAPELPGDERFSHSSERCAVASPASVSFSLAFPEGNYLISADTGAGFALPGDADPCALLDGASGGASEPVPLLEFTPEELEAGLENPDGYRLSLVPRSGFVAGGEGFLFYEKLLSRGVFEILRIGIGVAKLRFGEPAVRLTPNRFISEPTLLWLESRPGRAASAVLGADGLAYVYNVFPRGQFDTRVYLARVPPESIDELPEYRYFARDTWSDTEERAEPVFGGARTLSIVHSERLDSFVFVFAPPLSDVVIGMIGSSPAGPFGELQRLYEGVRPEDFWIRDVAVHSGFGADGGKTLLTSYYSTGGDSAGIRLVDVVLR